MLLMLGGASGTVSFTPLTFGDTAVILMPDEVAVGQPVNVYAQIVDSSGPVTLAEPAQWAVYGFDVNGVRSELVPVAQMTQVGSADLWVGTWTPSASGTYEVVVAMNDPPVYSIARALTVRPKFDPIGLAVDDVLVSRTGDDDVLGTA